MVNLVSVLAPLATVAIFAVLPTAPPSPSRPSPGAPASGSSSTPSPAATPPAPSQPAAPRPPGSEVLIVSFENTSEDRSLYWVGEAIADGLTREIRQAGGEVVDRRERVALREEMGVPALSTLTLASQIRIADEVGARTLVTGSFGASGEVLTVRARVIDIPSARTGLWINFAGSARDIVSVQRELFKRLRPSLPAPRRRGESGAAIAEDGVPQGAYELVLKSFLEDASDKRQRMLRRALELAPDYLRAKMELAQTYREANQLDKAAETLSSIATRDAALAAEGEILVAEIHLEMGHSSEAEAAVRRSLAAKETARGHLVLAKLATARGDRALAKTEASRSRALSPNDPEILEVEQAISKMP